MSYQTDTDNCQMKSKTSSCHLGKTTELEEKIKIHSPLMKKFEKTPETDSDKQPGLVSKFRLTKSLSEILYLSVMSYDISPPKFGLFDVAKVSWM